MIKSFLSAVFGVKTKRTDAELHELDKRKQAIDVRMANIRREVRVLERRKPNGN